MCVVASCVMRHGHAPAGAAGACAGAAGAAATTASACVSVCGAAAAPGTLGHRGGRARRLRRRCRRAGERAQGIVFRLRGRWCGRHRCQSALMRLTRGNHAATSSTVGDILPLQAHAQEPVRDQAFGEGSTHETESSFTRAQSMSKA
eukprot:366517-Chlamydomonas_euryale.AAC.15